jgi:hypothetical protein
MNSSTLFSKIEQNLKDITFLHSLLNSVIGKTPPSFNFDPMIDDIRFSEPCQSNISSDAPIDYYSCLSFDRTISFYLQLIRTGKDLVDEFPLSHSYWKRLNHILNSLISLGYRHLFEQCHNVIRRKVDFFILYYGLPLHH